MEIFVWITHILFGLSLLWAAVNLLTNAPKELRETESKRERSGYLIRFIGVSVSVVGVTLYFGYWSSYDYWYLAVEWLAMLGLIAEKMWRQYHSRET
jgi:hypothetical protein